ncbi:MAG: prepilin-type N-terminal cleavage/methylation domain-containing protein, partial [Candidatus Giovannonibacteria bacterium]|nr:prepilin-type N-terminal cleavage/methylation domain-containing protein [Candidatus Giovannonibacteria bacterium]
MKNQKSKNKNSGFSLLETTVAIAILVASVIGPLSLASSSIKASSQAKNNLAAAGLTQEGVELMRNFRANNVFKGFGWTAGMESCFSAAGCQIDAAVLEIAACGTFCS